MKFTICLIIIACAALLVGCAASIPPMELVDARQAYAHASAGRAGELVPAELEKAREALASAEKSFRDDPASFRTRDLAYVANRKAKTAEALAGTATRHAATAKANEDYQATQTEIAKNIKDNLPVPERSGGVDAVQFAMEVKARVEIDKKAADAQAHLVKLAVVKEEARGLVIMLPDRVLFTSNTSTLSSAAHNRLKQVADALMVMKERKLTVEGHTDSQGPSSQNQELSRQRADAVRSYFISRGYPGELIQAQGIGKDRPIADNASAEGRANNCRVEIIVNRTAEQGPGTRFPVPAN